MQLFGTMVNTLAIVAGSLVGLLFRRGLPDPLRVTVIQSTSLAVLLVGIKGALAGGDLLLMIFSLAIGSVLGEWLGIEARLRGAGEWIEGRLSAPGGGIAQGFVTASLAFCVGSMAVVGSLESGLSGNHDTLLAKAVLDGFISMVFASALGPGVILSAAAVLLYQGALTLAAGFLKPLLVPEVVGQMSAVGGLLIVAIGLNLLDVAQLRVGNMLPAVFIPLAWNLLRRLL
jgi:hypothetical protein